MKFLKAFLVVLLLIIASLLLIGVFVPEVDDEFETRIDRPVIQVYSGMMNVQGLTDWVGGLERVERTSGFLAMPGSTFQLHYAGTETEVVYTLEVVEVDPMRSLKIKLYNDMLALEISVNFESEGASTVLETYVQMKGKDLISRSFLPLMKGTVMDVGKENFASYKQLVESK